MDKFQRKHLFNSEKRVLDAKEFMEELKVLLETTQGDTIKIETGKKRTYFILKDNLKDILNYTNYLLINQLIKPISSDKVVRTLIHFAHYTKKPFREIEKEDIEKFFASFTIYSEGYSTTVRRIVKPFFRWLYNFDEEYPDIVKWIKFNRNNNKRLPEILTMEEIQKMIEICDNFRDRALVAIFYESGGRASEILDLKISDINFDEYGGVIIVNGKTGSRRIRLISSVPDLKAWLNIHPRKNEPNAPLFCSLSKNTKNAPLRSSSLNWLIRDIAKKAGMTKKVYPHIFRHTRATHLAKHLTEQELKIYFGWTKDSKMTGTYIHLSGKDVEDKILKLNGIIQEENGKPPVIPLMKCYRCGENNSIGNKFCWKCSAPLTEEKIKETEMTMRFLSEIIPLIFEKVKERDVKNDELDEITKILKGLYNIKRE